MPPSTHQKVHFAFAEEEGRQPRDGPACRTDAPPLPSVIHWGFKFKGKAPKTHSKGILKT